MHETDVLISSEGTIIMFSPLTDRAKQWVNDHVKSESYQWIGTSLAVEYRYALGLMQGMNDAGLVMRW